MSLSGSVGNGNGCHFLFEGRGFVGLCGGLSIPLTLTYEEDSNPTIDS